MTRRRKPDLKHEALCRRCGSCCYEKFVVQDTVFTSRTPCKFLNEKTRLCTVYARRFEMNSRCADVESGIRLGVFPADCPYVKGREGYVPPEEDWLDEKTAREVEDGRYRTADEVRQAMKRNRASRSRKSGSDAGAQG